MRLADTKAKKNPYLLFSLLFGVYLLASLFAIEAVNIFQDGTGINGIYMTDMQFFIANIMAIIFGIFIYVFAKKMFYVRNSWLFFIVILLLFIFNTYATLSFPNSLVLSDSLSYTISNLTKVRYAFSFVNVCIAVYLCVVIGPQCKLGESGWNYFFAILSLFALAAVIYSFFHDKGSYDVLFNKDYQNGRLPQVASFLVHKNNYGAILMFAIMGEMLMFASDKKWWHILLILFFSLNVLLSYSKTSIICVAILLDGAGLILYLTSLKKGKNALLASILFLALVAFNVLIAYLMMHSQSTENTFLSVLFRNIRKAVLEKDDSTLGSRFVLWRKAWDLLKSNNSFFVYGMGDQNFPFVFSFASDTDWKYSFYTHNGLLEVLCRGGLIRLVAYIFFLVFILVLVIKFSLVKRTKGGLLYLLFFIIFVLRSFVENEFLMANDMKALLWNLFLTFPLMGLHYNEKNGIMDKEIVSYSLAKSKIKDGGKLSPKIMLVLLAISLTGVSSALSCNLAGFGSASLTNWIMVIAGTAFLFSLISLIAYHHKNENFVVFLIVLSLIGVTSAFVAPYLILKLSADTMSSYSVTVWSVCFFISLYLLLVLIDMNDKSFDLLVISKQKESKFSNFMIRKEFKN